MTRWHCQACAKVVSAKQALRTRLVMIGMEKLPVGRGGRSVGVGMGVASNVDVAVEDVLGSLP